jgi:hypothetical protein
MSWAKALRWAGSGRPSGESQKTCTGGRSLDDLWQLPEHVPHKQASMDAPIRRRVVLGYCFHNIIKSKQGPLQSYEFHDKCCGAAEPARLPEHGNPSFSLPTMAPLLMGQ